MYGKLFASLYQGTLRGRANEILVFTNLIAHADRDGFVDKHWRAISEEVGLSVEDVKSACAALEAPDPESRTPDQGGARIQRMDDHRAWGWHIVNYAKYREIRHSEERRAQNRAAQQRRRSASVSQCQPTSAVVSHGQPQSAHAEVEAEAKADADNTPKTVGASRRSAGASPAADGQWIESLKVDPTYNGIDVGREFGKCAQWCEAHKKVNSRKRFINWLNRADKPISAASGVATGYKQPTLETI